MWKSSVFYFLGLTSLVHAVPFSSKVHKRTALIIIDVQNDFITDWHPIGHVSFASSHLGKQMGDTVNITFVDTPKKVEAQSLAADHCVPETWGAEIETGVRTRLHLLEGFRTPVHYVKKAQDHGVDSYSAFADNQYHRFTTLDSELALHGVETLVVTGLATNACVRGTSIDGVKLGYEVVLIEDATEGTSAEAKRETIEELEGWGVQVMNLTDWEAANNPFKSPCSRRKREL